jgi:hypothetical protein
MKTTSPMKLSDREKKLLILAYDRAAEVGEALAAIRALAKAWVLRYDDGYALIKDLEEPEKEVIREKIVYRNNNPYGEFVLNFGKHKGLPLRKVPVSYLIWCLEDFEDLWPATRKAIKGYLEGK